MGKHEATENNVFLKFLKRIYISYIPNKRDNIKQIFIKLMFLVSFVTLIVSASYIANYFLVAQKQNNIIDESRKIWYADTESADDPVDARQEKINALLAENSDFKGWISISGTQVNNPIYQTDNNNYYLKHNQKKERNIYGALYFDYKNVITEEQTDKNLVIYGHEMNNGSMFGTLKKFKSLDFYKENPLIEFSTLYKSSTYKIYAIFVLNAQREDDDGYIYNIYRKSFLNSDDFNSWAAEAYERSVIDTGVDVELGDNIITLVTCSTSDFENARLVIMARETREGEGSAVDTSAATVNPSPRYPKKWYTKRGINK